MKVLWLARALPLPLDAGDRIYSAYLSESVAEASDHFAFIGLEAGQGEGLDKLGAVINWRLVPGQPRSQLQFLFSDLPMSSVRSRTRRFRTALRRALLDETWDMIVLEHYAMVWCLDEIEDAKFAGVIAHVAQNYETKVLAAIASNFQGNPLKRQLLWMNAKRTKRAEERFASTCHLISAITDDDAREFKQLSPKTECIVLSPGFKATRTVDRELTAATPRRVVMLGSFQWLAKQMNLQEFVITADRAFAEAGIEFCVIGSVPDQLKTTILKEAKATRLLGFVEDPVHILAESRISVLFERTGGGFKLKMLDYIFNKLPLFALDVALAGLPPEVLRHVAPFPSLPSLVQGIVDSIDDLSKLNTMKNGAIAAAEGCFDWKDRGRKLVSAAETQLAAIRSRVA